MPGALEAFAANQPISQAIDAVRALFRGEPLGDHVWITAVMCVGIAARLGGRGHDAVQAPIQLNRRP